MQLKHLKQLVEYTTGMDTRIGYPNEHLSGDTREEMNMPLYATSIGLLLDILERKERNRIIQKEEEQPRIFDQKREQIEQRKDGNPHDKQEKSINETEVQQEFTSSDADPINIASQPRKNVLEKWTEKFKEFLDQAD